MKFVKTQKKIILLLLLILGMIVALITAALVIYPRMSYNQNTLYGEQNENLKDFSEEEGIITAETSNPWIMLPLGRKMGVYSIILYVSDMTGENNANITILNSNGEFGQYQFLKNGKNEINFRFQVLPAETDFVRLDVTDVTGNSMRVYYAVINSWQSVILGVL